MKFVFTTLLFPFFLLLDQIYSQNNSLNFDGSNDYISATQQTTVKNNFTIEFWANPTATIALPAQSTSGTGGISGQRFSIFPVQGSVFCSNCAGAGVSVGTNGVCVIEHGSAYVPSLLTWSGTISGWTHIAIVYTNKQPSLYINGVLTATGLTSTKTDVYVTTNSFGGGAYGYFRGDMDELRIWSVLRTQTEIQANMNMELSSGTGLMVSYHFNQGVAGGNNSGVTTLLDALSNNNGTLNFFALIGSTSNWVGGAISILSVELLNFEGRNTEEGNMLTWQTVSEIQNKGFDIERSTDGIYFGKIGFVGGNGTTNQKQDYSFKDKSFDRVVYYRLKQLDFDGRFEYSKIILISGKGETLLSVSPNPNDGIFKIFGVDDTDTKSCTLINSVGQTVSIKVQNDGQIDMSVCPPGVYYLCVSNRGQVIRLVKE